MKRRRLSGPGWREARAAHDALLDRIVEKHALTRDRFMPAVRAALLTSDGVTAAEWREWFDASHWIVVPDAFKIDQATKTFTVYEVEITSFVNEEKLDKLAHLYWSVNEWHWDVRLVRVDSLASEVEIGMFTHAVRMGRARMGTPALDSSEMAELAARMACRP